MKYYKEIVFDGKCQACGVPTKEPLCDNCKPSRKGGTNHLECGERCPHTVICQTRIKNALWVLCEYPDRGDLTRKKIIGAKNTGIYYRRRKNRNGNFNHLGST